MAEINPHNTLGSYSTREGDPDYACERYREMFPTWQVAEDAREGTEAYRTKRDTYLPRFESEEPPDWTSRVGMTFATDMYDLTLEEHVGLVTAEPVKLGDDVPAELVALAEGDFNGQGDSLDVFVPDVLDSAMHFGHVGVWTDYPDTTVYRDLGQKRAAGVRAYAVLFPAPDILDWEETNVAGRRCLTFVSLREWSAGKCRYRHVSQAVTVNEVTGQALALGAITWELWEKTSEGTSTSLGTGTIVGPEQIPLRVIYGGRKKGTLYSVPHLKGLAYTTIEHVQVTSDYANVMHKCNVPTPVFSGREKRKEGETVVMGQGIDLPIGGSAMMLEPSGAAINSTEKRLTNLEMRMQRQGATTSDGGGKVLTATEASMVAKSRNAKVKKGAKSLHDGMEGVLADMAAFMGLPQGGSLEVNMEFAGPTLDPAYLTVLVNAFDKKAIPIDAFLYALERGELPPDFSRTDTALRLIADWEAGRVEEEEAGLGDEEGNEEEKVAA